MKLLAEGKKLHLHGSVWGTGAASRKKEKNRGPRSKGAGPSLPSPKLLPLNRNASQLNYRRSPRITFNLGAIRVKRRTNKYTSVTTKTLKMVATHTLLCSLLFSAGIFISYRLTQTPSLILVSLLHIRWGIFFTVLPCLLPSRSSVAARHLQALTHVFHLTQI